MCLRPNVSKPTVVRILQKVKTAVHALCNKFDEKHRRSSVVFGVSLVGRWTGGGERGGCGEGWSESRDSNPGPRRPERRALPTALLSDKAQTDVVPYIYVASDATGWYWETPRSPPKAKSIQADSQSQHQLDFLLGKKS